MSKQSIASLLALLLLLPFGCGKKDESPDPSIAATYKGGQITRKDVEDSISVILRGLDPETIKQIQRSSLYEKVVKGLVLDNLIKDKVKEKKLDKRKNVKHVMKHISEEINIDELHTQAHKSKIKVSETEIRSYYEDNRDQFEDSSLSEVREEIHLTLQSTKEKGYFQNYLSDQLKL